MQQYKCIIVEDEPAVANQIKRLINAAHPELLICSIAHRVDEGVAQIKQYQPELLFLDISLGGETGFDLLKQVTEPCFEIIVITAYERYAIEALRWSAADYLLKPVQPFELRLALSRAYQRLGLDSNTRLLNAKAKLHELLNRVTFETTQIGLPVLDGTLLVRAGDILFLEAEGSYSRFYFIEGNTLLITKGLYYFAEQLLLLGFIRCHAAYIVNKRYIKKILQTDGIMELVMTNELRVVVSRKYHKAVREALKGF